MRRVLCALAVVCGATVAHAQTGGPYDLSWNTVHGGGGRSSGGAYMVSGTAGAFDAGTMIGGAYTLAGGFWKGGSPFGATAIGDDPAANALPRTFAVHANAPNPFHRTTTVRFDLPESREVDVSVFDVRGARVRRLAAGTLPAGRHARAWDGRDATGRDVAPGVYLLCVRAGVERLEQRLLRVR